MKKRTLLNSLLMLGVCSTALFSCSKDKNDDNTSVVENPSTFVFVVNADGSSEGGSAGSYVVNVDDVSKGQLSIIGNGIPSNEFYFNVQNNYVFGLTYSNEGPMTPYGFNEKGVLTRFDRKTINTIRPGIYGNYGSKNIVIGSTNRALTNPVATLLNVDVEANRIQNESTLNLSTDIAGAGRMIAWTGLFQVGDKIYVPYQITEGVGNWGGEIVEQNKATIAIFDYPGLKLVKKIEDDRGSYIGNWGSNQGIGVSANGDAYTWFTAGEKSKNKSGILRIKKGTDEFDKSYYFNVEDLGKGKIARGNHLSGDKYLMTMYQTAETGGTAGGKVNLAIVDVAQKTVVEVKGAPDHDQSSYNNKVYTEKNGKTAYYVLQDPADGEFYVYVIDVATAKATKGLKFVGISDVNAFSKLETGVN
ncbi:DUF4374 domain-containing protein [Sphingobacterium yanglingense]|uniref:Uncharacterized protein DUF4374 n=1 Tax=Sphingobacterium yanglingense TaxID=1437280 RepID=A0A4R6WI92_9SPHI|nr:DUF4374 domain-containing protein [Sphingobacterium yanglingense]TDQ78256.1 uncharacterized protein DUF4374 [Sphingobacterium yanglingense]